MGRILVKVAGLLLGMLLIVTGLAKIAGIGEFASGIVREFSVPRELGTVCAFAIVAVELFCGVGFYFRRTRRLSGAVAGFLFFLFVILILRKTIQGSEFECDCFGILALRLSLFSHLVLDITLALVSLLVAFGPTGGRMHYVSPRRFPIAFLVPLLLCTLMLIWALLSAFRSPAAAAAPEEKRVELNIAFPVKPVIVRRATLVKGISSSGLLRPVRTVELVPGVSGEIVATAAYEGKEVAKGEIVAVIDRTAFRLAFERASYALLAAQIEYRTLNASPFLQTMDTLQARRELEAAREHFQRVRTAYAAGRIDGPGFVRAQREYEAARAYLSANREDVIMNRSGLAVAREAYERAKLDLDATEIRAPIAGRLVGWEGTVGMQVHAGRTLCSLVDVSGILIDVDIAEKEADKVRTGAAAIISCMAFPEIRLAGIVRTVSPVIDLKSRMMRVTIAVRRQHADRNAPVVELRPGMFASVLVETGRLENRLLVPREALLVRDERQLVFTMQNGRAKWQYVETGEENLELVEIRSGLSSGDTIIVEGHQALAHDAQVYIRK